MEASGSIEGMRLLLRWLTKIHSYLHRNDPVWLLGRPYSPEQLDEIDRTMTGT